MEITSEEAFKGNVRRLLQVRRWKQRRFSEWLQEVVDYGFSSDALNRLLSADGRSVHLNDAVALAFALRTSPLFLVVPYELGAHVRISERVTVPAREMREWWSGSPLSTQKAIGGTSIAKEEAQAAFLEPLHPMDRDYYSDEPSSSRTPITRGPDGQELDEFDARRATRFDQLMDEFVASKFRSEDADRLWERATKEVNREIQEERERKGAE